MSWWLMWEWEEYEYEYVKWIEEWEEEMIEDGRNGSIWNEIDWRK